MSGQTASHPETVKYKTRFAFLWACFSAVCGNGRGHLGVEGLKGGRGGVMYLHVFGRIMVAEVSLQLCRWLHRGSSRLIFFFFFSCENCPQAGSWRWKMRRATTFERFIFPRWCTYIMATTINDILQCKLEMHQQELFFYSRTKTLNFMEFIR